MEIGIIETLIAGGFSILSVIVTLVGKEFFENRSRPIIEGSRGKCLVGHWEGKTFQPNEDIHLVITADLSVKRNKVSGSFKLTELWNDEKHTNFFDLDGEFHYSKYLHFRYKTSENGAIQFGSMLLTLDNHGGSLQGKFVGYGKRTDDVVWGIAELEKVPIK